MCGFTAHLIGKTEELRVAPGGRSALQVAIDTTVPKEIKDAGLNKQQEEPREDAHSVGTLAHSFSRHYHFSVSEQGQGL